MVIFVDYVLFMCRKDFKYIEDMIIQCFSLMIDIGEDDDDVVDWFGVDDFEDQESDNNYVVGEYCMDCLVNKMGGMVVLQFIFVWFLCMMQFFVWRDRYVVFMVIFVILEGCCDQMIGEFEQVLKFVVLVLKDFYFCV